MTAKEFLTLDYHSRRQLDDWFKFAPSGTSWETFLKDYKYVDGEIRPVETSDHDVIYNDFLERKMPLLKNEYKEESDSNCNKESVSGIARYHDGVVETIDYIESMCKCWDKNGVPADKIYDLAQVLRYLSSRLGVKDPVDIEIGKAHNYLHRAMTGKWYEK